MSYWYRRAVIAKFNEALVNRGKTTPASNSGSFAPKAVDLAVSDKYKEHAAKLSDQTKQYIVDRLKEGEKHKPAFDQHIKDIADAIHGSAKLTNNKKLDSVVRKVASDYNGDATMLKDLVRATLTTDTPEQLEAAVQMIHERFDVSREKLNLLMGKTDEMGYSDVKINVRFSATLEGEIQLMPSRMLEVKDGRGHEYYEAKREITGRAVIENRPLTQEEVNKVTELIAVSNRLYGPITDPFIHRKRG